MAKTVARRNVGMEILEGLRQLKRGEVERVINVPAGRHNSRTHRALPGKVCLTSRHLGADASRMGTRSPRSFRCCANSAHRGSQESAGSARSCIERAALPATPSRPSPQPSPRFAGRGSRRIARRRPRLAPSHDNAQSSSPRTRGFIFASNKMDSRPRFEHSRAGFSRE